MVDENYPGFQHKAIWTRNFYQAIDSMVDEKIELVCVDIPCKPEAPTTPLHGSAPFGEAPFGDIPYRNILESVKAVSFGNVFVFCDTSVLSDVKSCADSVFGANTLQDNILWTHNFGKAQLDKTLIRYENHSRRYRDTDTILHYCTDTSVKKRIAEGSDHIDTANFRPEVEAEGLVFKQIISKGTSEGGKVLSIMHDAPGVCIEADRNGRKWMGILEKFPFSHEMRMTFYSSKVRFQLLD